MNPIPTRIITVYNDGTINVQELHPATISSLTEDETPPPGDGIETPPKPPGNP